MLTFVDNWTPLGRPLHLPLGRSKAAALSNTSKQLRLVDERFVGLTPDLFASMAAASTSKNLLEWHFAHILYDRIIHKN